MSIGRARTRAGSSVGGPLRVGLYGLLGSGNVGNDSSLEAVMTYLRANHAGAAVDFMCAGPERIRAEYRVPAIPIRWYANYEESASGLSAFALRAVSKGVDALRTASWVRRHDVVIVPGTGILETTLPQRPWGVPYATFLLCASGRLFGTRVLLVNVGATRARQRITQGLFTAAARLAAYRSFRDVQSREAMRSGALDTSRDRVYPDLAFALPVPPVGRTDPNVVGIGVMAYYGGNDDRRHGSEIYASYVEKMSSFVGWLVDNGRKVRFIVGDSVDYGVIEEILANLRADRPGLDPASAVAGRVSSWSDLTNEVASVSTVVATRYHNVLCALKLCKPTVSIAYGAKNDALMSSMGLSDFGLSLRSLNVEQLIDRFVELEKNSEKLKRMLEERNEDNVRRLEEQFDVLSTLLPPAREHAGTSSFAGT